MANKGKFVIKRLIDQITDERVKLVSFASVDKLDDYNIVTKPMSCIVGEKHGRLSVAALLQMHNNVVMASAAAVVVFCRQKSTYDPAFDKFMIDDIIRETTAGLNKGLQGDSVIATIREDL